MLHRSKWLHTFFILTLLCAGFVPGAAKAVTTSSVYVLLYSDQTQAYVNNKPVTLAAPSRVIDGRMFVPAKFIGDTFGFPVEWDAATDTIHIRYGTTEIAVDNTNRTVKQGDTDIPYDTVIKMVDNRLLVKLTWLMDLIHASYVYNPALDRVEIAYTSPAESLVGGTDNNSRPVAKFIFSKPSYKKGEPVEIIDLSYDVDLDGVGEHTWVGKQDAYFTSGDKIIMLRVKDGRGNASKWYERTIHIDDEEYLNELDFQIYHNPLSSFISLDRKTLSGNFFGLPELPKKVTQDSSRKLIVSDSPETVGTRGVLYRETVEGKARLYADHVNGTKEKMTIAVVAANPGPEPVTIHTTRQGEVYPSIYANLIGHEATVDFMTGEASKEDVVIPPGQTRMYALFPEMLPGYGVNLFYDIETSGKADISFLALGEKDSWQQAGSLPNLPFHENVRGTFPISDVRWDLDGSGLITPQRVIIGDGKTDAFIKGFDAMDKIQQVNYGNYGVMYHLHIDKPPRMAIMMLARGGVYKGPFQFNGQFLMAPAHGGVITPLDGVHLMWRTDGTEPSLDIEFSPPAGSAFPIDLIFYPLDGSKM